MVVHDLVITSRGGAVLRVEEEVVTAFTHAGSMTDLHVRETYAVANSWRIGGCGVGWWQVHTVRHGGLRVKE